MKASYVVPLLGLGLALGAGQAAQAQQMAQYSQYMNNNYLLNPGVAGTEDYIDLKFSYRAQWVGLEGAPRTFYASGNSALGPVPTASGRPMRSSGRGFHAVGGQVYRDVTGPTSRTGLYGSYTYNLPLTRTLRLALGAAVGMQQFSIDGAQLQFHNTATVVASQSSRVPDMMVGGWLYSPSFYVGLSAAQLLGNKLDLAYSVTNQFAYSNKLERHYFATAGVRLPINDDFTLVPSVLVKYMSPAPASVDVNAKLRFRELLWAGASWRVRDAVAAMLGINATPVVAISYSYDATTSELSGYQGGSHEVILSLKLNKPSKAICPDRFW